MSQRYLLFIKFLLTFLHVNRCIEAANTYSYSESYPSTIYPIHQRQVLTQLPQQQQQKYFPESILTYKGNGLIFQNPYQYRPFRGPQVFDQSRGSPQRNNYDTYTQPTRHPTTAYIQSESVVPQPQQQHQNPQQQPSSYWMGRPIVADYASINTDRYQSFRNDAYNPEISFTDTVHRITSPNYRDFLLSSAQNSAYSPTPIDYARHFEQYLRKYPKRLRPQFSGNDFRE